MRVLLIPKAEPIEVSGAGYTPEGEILLAGTAALPAPMTAAVRRLARAAVICNEGSLYREDSQWVHHGDAMDVAFLSLAYKAGLEPDRVRNSVLKVAEVPFESEQMYAAVYYREEGDTQVHLAVKGALEAVLPHCTTMTTADGAVPMTRRRRGPPRRPDGERLSRACRRRSTW